MVAGGSRAHLRGGDKSLYKAAQVGGNGLILARQIVDLGAAEQNCAPELEDIAVLFRAVGSHQIGVVFPSLHLAYGIGNGIDPPGQDLEVVGQGRLQRLDFRQIPGVVQLIELQAGLGTAQPQLEHALHEINVLFHQPVEGLQGGLDFVVVLD